MRNQFTRLRIFFFLLLFSGLSFWCMAQKKQAQFIAKPFANKVFIEERGQFTQRNAERGISSAEKVIYGVENGEFNAYFNRSGLTFQFSEYKAKERKNKLEENEKYEKQQDAEKEEAEEKKFDIVRHSVNLKFANANPLAEVVAEEKAREYYNYAGYDDNAQYNYVPAYKKIRYVNIYPGVDAEFELPAAGGIKYQFLVHPGVAIPEMALELTGNEGLALDADGNLLINSIFGNLTDHAPTAYTAVSHKVVEVKYSLEGNRVKFQFASSAVSSGEGIVIDPYITATTFPATNAAFDIQEDGAGNVFVLGSTTNYQVQKYDPAGALIWTYVTASVFLGDIAVDNPGNVYIVGGYSAGKRQKLDPNGVQQWQFSGLAEEWRLAFDYSKTVLTVGGYFTSPGGNNLGRFDTSTGTISNQINYGAETRGIATDCNGDMFSLHVTFGYAGAAASNMLRKTNANFTPGVAVQSGFLLAEAEPTTGYAPNPSYSTNIYQGINGLVVMGTYVYIFDGASIRRFDKATLTFINSVAVPNGSVMMCSGIAADNCGNIYSGSMNGIVEFDSALTYQQTISAPGVVYDILLSNSGELLVSGAGFLGNFDIACSTPAALSATTNSVCEGAGPVTIAPAGGLGPYTYLWQPNGETTASLSNPPAGTYSYVVSDVFCHTSAGTVTIPAKPVAAFTAISTGISNGGTNTACAADAIQFSDNSTVSSGSITSRQWDFGDGSPAVTTQNPQHVYSSPGTYNATLIVTTDAGCLDTSTVPVTVYPLPVANFTAPSFCTNAQGNFTNQSSIASGTVTGYTWSFGDGSPNSSLQSPAHTYNLPNTYNVNLSVTSDNGCTDDTTIAVVVNATPVAEFSATNVCQTAPTVFTDLSSVANPAIINSWEWDIDNNGSFDYNTANISHVFSTPGTHDVLLTVSSAGCVDDTMVTVTVFAGVIADFSTTNVCPDVAAVFTDQSTALSGNISGWDWNFGDANSSSVQSPLHTYTAAGTYSVQLRISSDQGCIDSITKPFTVYPLPVVDFATLPGGGCVPVNATLNDLSTIATGSNVTWNWQIGNLSSSSQQNTSFNFTTDGTYNITLTVTSDMGCADSLSKPLSVYPMPVPDFSIAPATGCVPLNVALNDQSSIASGSIATWNWQAGTLFSSTQQNANFNFTANGTFAITLTVTSNQGCTDSITKPLIVYPSPVVDFAAVPAGGCVPVNAALNDLSAIAAGSNVSWNWQIGNLSSSAQQNTSFNFTADGTYNITLTVTSDMGCTDSLTKPLSVYPMPVPDFSIAPATGCVPLNVALNDQSTIASGSIATWNWQAGTPFSSTQQNTNFNFTADGTYTITLTVTSNQGCTDSITKPLTVYPSPVVDFAVLPADGCVPLNVALNDLSSIANGSNVSWNWQIGTLFSSSLQNTNFNFTADGTYDVSLSVTSDLGCTTTLTRNDFITVYPNPVAAFAANPRQAELLYSDIKFTDLSTGNPLQWNWQFGTGYASTLQHPSYTYQHTGTFVVQLEIADEHGCADTITHTVDIIPASTIFIPNVFTPNGDGNNDTWGVIATNVKFFELKVFDRWGEKVFESNNINEQWDGTFQNKPIAPGVFVYQCTLANLHNSSRNLNGSVTLVR